MSERKEKNYAELILKQINKYREDSLDKCLVIGWSLEKGKMISQGYYKDSEVSIMELKEICQKILEHAKS